jgi:hypothetical protein
VCGVVVGKRRGAYPYLEGDLPTVDDEVVCDKVLQKGSEPLRSAREGGRDE